MKSMHVAVIGGGITGLTAAYELQKQFRSAGQPLEITVLEKSGQLGGAIQTLKRDGFVIEKGPDSFLARKHAALQLSQELGLMGDLVGLSPAASGSCIYLKGRLHPVPAGLALGIPTQIKPFIGTRLLSVPGKARAALDLLLPKKQPPRDESLGSLIKRRLGAQVADHLVSPILAGIYAGDLNMLSTAATFPQLLDMEQNHRSLILGMIASRKKPHASSSDSGIQLPAPLRRSMFLTYKGGLCTLVENLAAALEHAGARICLNSPVRSIARNHAGYELRLTDDRTMTADGMILAAPAEQAQHLIQGASYHLSRALGQIPSVSVANVAFALDRAQLSRPLQGTGVVIPRQEGLLITACTWASMKWAHTAPEGSVLIRAYIGHWADQRHTHLSDDKLKHYVLQDVERIIGQNITPLFSEVTRHSEAMSQYLVGHMQRLASIENELHAQFPNMVIAGRSYRGVGIPDCITQGKEAADRLYRGLM